MLTFTFIAFVLLKLWQTYTWEEVNILIVNTTANTAENTVIYCGYFGPLLVPLSTLKAH